MFLDKQVQDHSQNEFRGQLNYHFDTNVFNIPVKEWLSVSGGYQLHLLLTREYNGSFTDNYPLPWTTNNWTQDMIWAREYCDHPNTAINLPTEINGHPVVYQALPFNWFDHDLQPRRTSTSAPSRRPASGTIASTSPSAPAMTSTQRPPAERASPVRPALSAGSRIRGRHGQHVFGRRRRLLHEAARAVYNFSENFAPIGGGTSPSLDGDGHFGPAPARRTPSASASRPTTEVLHHRRLLLRTSRHGRISDDNINIQGIWNDYYKAGGTATDPGRRAPYGNGPEPADGIQLRRHGGHQGQRLRDLGHRESHPELAFPGQLRHPEVGRGQ